MQAEGGFDGQAQLSPFNGLEHVAKRHGLAGPAQEIGFGAIRQKEHRYIDVPHLFGHFDAIEVAFEGQVDEGNLRTYLKRFFPEPGARRKPWLLPHDRSPSGISRPPLQPTPRLRQTVCSPSSWVPRIAQEPSRKTCNVHVKTRQKRCFLRHCGTPQHGGCQRRLDPVSRIAVPQTSSRLLDGSINVLLAWASKQGL